MEKGKLILSIGLIIALGIIASGYAMESEVSLSDLGDLGNLDSLITGSEVLLDKKIKLYDNELLCYKEYYFDLKKDDKIDIEFSVTGDPIEILVYKETGEMSSPSCILEGDLLSFERDWVVPEDGRYCFEIESSGRSDVDIRITRG